MRYISILLLVFISLGASAQQKISLSDCREMALKHNKQNRVSVLQIDKASQDIITYRSKFFPHLSAEGNYLFNSKKLKDAIPSMTIPTLTGTTPHVPNGGVLITPDIPFNFNLNNSWMAGVMLKQPLYAGGKIRSAYKMAKLGKEMSILNHSMTNADVIYQTDQAYWTLIKVEEMLLVAQKYKEVVEHLLKDVENGYEVGMLSRNEILKVKVKLNEANLQYRRAENAVTLSKMNLCHIIGLPLLEDIDILNQDINQVTSYKVIHDVYLRPEYRILSKNLELKEQEIKLTRGSYLPQVGVMGGWNYYDALKFNDNKLFKGGSFSAMFSVSVPLFQWGEGISKVRAKKVEHQMAELQRDDATEKMILEMTMALNEIDESKLEVDMTSEALVQAAENLKISTEQYEVGLETLTDHMEAQTLWQKAWAQNVESKAQLRLNETNYLKASGQLEMNAKN